MDFAHKFLRSLPERYDTIVTLLVQSDVKTATPTQILGEVLTHDLFKKSQDEVHGGKIDEKKKSVAFKAQDRKIEEEDGCQEEESDEECRYPVAGIPTSTAARQDPRSHP